MIHAEVTKKTLFASTNPMTALIITCTVDQVITVCAFNFTCEVHTYLVGKDGGKRIKIPKI